MDFTQIFDFAFTIIEYPIYLAGQFLFVHLADIGMYFFLPAFCICQCYRFILVPILGHSPITMGPGEGRSSERHDPVYWRVWEKNQLSSGSTHYLTDGKK